MVEYYKSYRHANNLFNLASIPRIWRGNAPIYRIFNNMDSFIFYSKGPIEIRGFAYFIIAIYKGSIFIGNRERNMKYVSHYYPRHCRPLSRRIGLTISTFSCTALRSEVLVRRRSRRYFVPY